MKATHYVRIHPAHLKLIKQYQNMKDLRSLQVAHDHIVESGLKYKRLFEVEPVDNLPKTTHAQGKL